MILADTGIWIGHFRAPNATLGELLLRRMILMHPLVIGELALGTLRDRIATLSELLLLPAAVRVSDDDVLTAIEVDRLMGRGIGWVDCALLASVRATEDAALWTDDRKFGDVAAAIGVRVV